ncbi:hypothetical protein MOC70_08610 [Bacillus vallismortis]|uniref:hypothetical protein n=1 Tax=Bacillus vallismortis TaxID=72361 RepID=UPI002280C3AC|nr:hypothetical protein [Bacillus vallismortis]MCY8424682.1 hypothetical protein [Bacillus vallismortis]MCY8535303.1 hypothetical protein [Bacillus vallismortis]
MNWLVGLDWGIQWGTVITVTGTLTAAFLGQVFAHRYSQKREDIKFKKECFQNLYSPIVVKIENYLFAENHKTFYLDSITEEEYNQNLKDDYYNPSRLFNEIVDTVGLNLRYANQELIMEYQDIIALLQIDDSLADWPEPKINFSNIFLLEYVQLSKDLGVYSPKIKEKVEKSLFFTQFYQVLSEAGYNHFKEELIRQLLVIESFSENLNKVVKLNNKFNKKNLTKEARHKLRTEVYKLLQEIGDNLPPDMPTKWFDLLEAKN